MHRIDGPGNVSGSYSGGIPGVQQATRVTADAMNAIQEEICGVIESTGAVLNKADNTQLTTALEETYGRLAQTNTWTAANTFDNSLTANVVTINGALTANSTITLNNDVTVLGAVSATELIAGAGGISTAGSATVGGLTVQGVTPASSDNIANKLTLANVVKVVATVTPDATTPILRGGAHVASVATSGVNLLRVTFAAPFANEYYVCAHDSNSYETFSAVKNPAFVEIGAKDRSSGATIPIGTGYAGSASVTVSVTIVGDQ